MELSDFQQSVIDVRYDLLAPDHPVDTVAMLNAQRNNPYERLIAVGGMLRTRREYAVIAIRGSVDKWDDKPLDVYQATSKTVDIATDREYYDFVPIGDEGQRFALEVAPMEPNRPARIDDLEVTDWIASDFDISRLKEGDSTRAQHVPNYRLLDMAMQITYYRGSARQPTRHMLSPGDNEFKIGTAENGEPFL